MVWSVWSGEIGCAMNETVWSAGKHRPIETYHAICPAEKVSAIPSDCRSVRERFVPLVGFAEDVRVMPARERSPPARRR